MQERQEMEESEGGREKGVKGRRSEGGREGGRKGERGRETEGGGEITDMMTSLESMKTLDWLHPGLPSDTSQ